MRKLGRKIAGLLAGCLFLGTVLAAGGCGDVGKGKEGQDSSKDSRSYGRYMESTYGLTGEVDRNGGFTQLEDGSYKLVGYNTGVWTSGDQGMSWEKEEPLWMQLLSHTYCPCAVFAPDGTMAAVSNGSISDIVVEAVKEGRLLTEEEEQAALEEPIPEGAAVENIWDQNQFGILVTPQGEIRYLNFGLGNTPSDNKSISRLWFSPDNRLFGAAVDGAVYEIDQETGGITLLFTADAEVGYLAFTEDCLLAVGRKNLYQYDRKEKTLLDENPAIDTFIAEKIGGGSTSYTIGSFPVAIAASRDGRSIYLSCRDGLYRAALDGSRVEQIIDGALSVFGDEEVVRLQELENEEFLVQFADSSLIRYAYDETVPTMPEKELSVYSFMEEPLIRQVVTDYKKKHSDTYVRYEVGYNREDGVTEEDAIKNLNTRLAAGKGPDVLVFDSLTSESYIEKGILADLSELFAQLQGKEEVLPNILEGMKTDGKLYQMPMCFSVPVIVGEKEAVEKAQTLEGLADYAEENAEEEDGGIIGIHKAEALGEVLTHLSYSAWMQDSSTLDEEALRDFLTQAKRIYDAENQAVTQTEREELDAIDAQMDEYRTGVSADSRKDVGNNVMYMAGGYQKIAVGELKDVWFGTIQICSYQNIQENVEFAPFYGQGEKYFYPSLPTGINASTENREAAEEFIRTMFSEETQETVSAFPVNKAAFNNTFVNEAISEQGDDFITGSMGYPLAGRNSIETDEYGKMDLYWPDQEQIERLKELLTSAETPAAQNLMLYNVMCETAPQVLEETLSVEEGLEKIKKEMALYLAE